MKNTGFTVTLTLETPWGIEAQKPLIVGADHATARSIHRHFYKATKPLWSDRDQSGLYVTMISREFCTNHEDFEFSKEVYLIDELLKAS